MGLAAAILLIGIGVGAWYFLGRGSTQQDAATTVPATNTQPAALTPDSPVQAAPVPAGPTREELEAQIRTMLDAQSQQMEAKLKSQYEDRVKQLQQQLQETKQREEQARQAPAPAPADPEPAAQEPVKQADPTPVQSAPAPAPAATTPPAATTSEKTDPASAQTRPQTTAPAPAPAQPAAKPAQIEYGDLVQPGTPGITPPKIKGRLDPRYPSAAQRLNKSAVVYIKVLVDERGNVLDAQRSGPKAGFGFDEAAVEAARRANFNPASTKDGVKVKMWTVLRVSFQPGR